MRLFHVFVFLMASTALYASSPTLNVTDPKGDDYGAGYVVYPGNDLWEKGDLDIISMETQLESDGIWFEVHLSNPIKSPKNRVGTFGDEDLTHFVKYDFFNLNLEIYLDQKSGEGNTWTLPGRQVSIHPDSAWEKAIILVPRPRVLQTQLESYWRKQFKNNMLPFTVSDSSEVENYMEHHLFFPTRIKVAKRSIRFFVPLEFLGEKPTDSWKLTAFTTAANPTQSLALNLPGKKESPIMLVTVDQGWPKDNFGTGDMDPFSPSAVIDLLCPEDGLQEMMLKRNPSILLGIKWSNPQDLKVSDLLKMPSDQDVKPTAPQTTSPVPKPEPPGVSMKPEPKPGNPKITGEKSSTAERLKELKALLEQGLITEEEYQKIRTRILSQL